jgi:hypothetical protein
VFRDPEPDTIPPECELGLSVRRVMRRDLSTVTAEVVVRPVCTDEGQPPGIDAAFLPSYHDEGCYSGAVFEGFEISAWYNGRHFYDSGYAYVLHRPLYTDWAQAIARQLHTIDQALRERAAADHALRPDPHSYPELVIRIAEVIGARFVQYQLDVDPLLPFTLTDLPGLATAFEHYIPRDRTTEPAPF